MSGEVTEKLSGLSVVLAFVRELLSISTSTTMTVFAKKRRPVELHQPPVNRIIAVIRV